MLGITVPLLLEHIRRLPAAVRSDEQLLGDFLSRRNEDAFAALVRRHGQMVLNVCRRILHDAHAAEDVFQATFLVLADRAAAIHRRESLAGFLHGVAYRLAVRARRSRARTLPPTAREETAGPAEELAWKEMLGILDEELGQLSDPYRAPLLLCYLEGRTQDEAARQLGWSLNTLRRRLARGRQVLEARLRSRGVTLSSALAGLLAAHTVAVPAHLQAATLDGAGAPVVEGTALSGGRSGILLLTTSGKMLAAFGAVATLGLLCFAGIWASHAGRAQTANPGNPLLHASAADQGDPHADPLPAHSMVRFGTARYRHGTRIESMAVSADASRAVVSSGHGWFTGLVTPAGVFDLKDGRCLYSLPNERGSTAEAVGLSPDGKTLAVRDNRFLTFRNAATGKVIRKIDYLPTSGGGRSPTDWMTFTPDGKHVAVTLMGESVQLIDAETCKVVQTFATTGAASACVFTADGKFMATGGYDLEEKNYCVRIWEVRTGKELRRFPAARFPIGNGGKRTLAFSHEGATVAGGGWGDTRLRLWETATGKEPILFPRTGEEVHSVAFSPDGKTVAAASDRIYLYDPATGKERLRIERRAQKLAFSQDSSVLTGAVSGAVYRWDPVSGRQLTPASAQDSAVEQVLVSGDGRQVFSTDQEGDLYVWDATGGKSPRRIDQGVKLGVVASPDGRFLARTVRDIYGNSRIRLYDIAGKRFIDRFPIIAGEATVAAFLPDGKSLITLAGGPPTFRVWDVASGKEIRSFVAIPPKSVGNPGSALGVVPFCTPRRVALSPDGKMLAIGPDFPEGVGFEGRSIPVRLWDVATGKAGLELHPPMNVGSDSDEADLSRRERLGRGHSHRQMKSMDGRAFSPDGRFLVDWAEHPIGRSRIDHVHVWEVATGRAIASLVAGPRAGAANAAFAPDGRTLAVPGADGTVRLWETATWTVRAEFRGHRGRVTALAFGPDGRLFTGGLDTTILGWNVRPAGDVARETLAAAWEALAAFEGKAGFAAQGRFLAEPGKAVEWFGTRVAPVHLDPSSVKGLIADLDRDDFATRERATAELQKQWPVAAAALREAVAKSPSVEARRRAADIIRRMEKPAPPSEELRALRAVEVLEWIATKGARAQLHRLTKGTPVARPTQEAAAACRRLEGRK